MRLNRPDTDREIERNLFPRHPAADARQHFPLTLAQRAHSIGCVSRVRIAELPVFQQLVDLVEPQKLRLRDSKSHFRLGKGVGQWLTRSLGASLPKSIRTDNPGARLNEFAIFAIAID